MTLRDRRLQNEWNFLLELQQYNPELILDASRRSLHGGDWLEFTLRETSAISLTRTAEHRYHSSRKTAFSGVLPRDSH